MGRRRIGQEDLIARPEPRAGATLTELAALIDWTEIDRRPVGISAAVKGELGWPPLALFRALLLATWHDLSDVRLAEALDDRASFRRFCGFAAHKPTPERTAFVRFRAELVRRGRLVAHNAAWCTDHGCGRTDPYLVRVRRGGRSSGVPGP